MKTAFESKPGTVLKIDGELFFVSKYEYHRAGRGTTTIKMRLKNLMNNSSTDRTFNGEDKMDDVILDRARFEYLYGAGGVYAFMNQTTYEQIELDEDTIGDMKYFLVEGNTVDIQQYEGKFIGLVLPTNIKLTIEECEPGVKGNTADGKVTKDAITNTGLNIKVPGFINQGDEIIVNTETGEYMERAK
ncbi:MAG: elongation factor P [Candidatus Gracilibacteria bacterium]|nr:elongation factor P [Candidatus Gracilibacteria bacterium]